ncbi:MAG: hypothetical protein ACREQC_05460 [Candidatus Binataceae bacterium]
MYIFIDESGTFSGYHDTSVNVVGALAIPDGKLAFLKKKYAPVRTRLPIERGEVKGRSLNEGQINEVIELLARNDVLFEVVVVDLAFQTEAEVAVRKQAHANEMLARAKNFREPDRTRVEQAARQISETSLPLYIQAIATFEVLHQIICNVPLYFVQRQPHELGSFTWVVDGKDPRKVTKWELWWAWYAQGALATMSKSRPAPTLEGADYSFYDQFARRDGSEGGTDLRLLLANLKFSSLVDPGLEFADIVVNAIRRALTGTLAKPGWKNIPRLMVHRKEPYIQLCLLKEGPDLIHHPSYTHIINDYFCSGGRPMMAPRFIRQYRDEI